MLAEGDYTHLLLVDSDVVPEQDTLQKLLSRDKPIVIAPVWFADDDAVFYGAYHKWSSSKEEEQNEKRMVPCTKGLERIVSGGFGCMLVCKDVANTFTKSQESFVQWSPLLPKHMKERASDNIFWAKCTNLGIEAYIDWSIETTHYRVVGLSNNLVNNLRKAKGPKDV